MNALLGLPESHWDVWNRDGRFSTDSRALYSIQGIVCMLLTTAMQMAARFYSSSLHLTVKVSGLSQLHVCLHMLFAGGGSVQLLSFTQDDTHYHQILKRMVRNSVCCLLKHLDTTSRACQAQSCKQFRFIMAYNLFLGSF
jgi:hypothetical protein